MRLKSDLINVKKAASLIPMCSWCLGRLVTSDVKIAKIVGNSLGVKTVYRGCILCLDSYSQKDELVERAVKKLEGFEYDTFQVGVTVPKICIETEDELRAKLKLKDGIVIKRALTALFKDELRKKVNKLIDNDNWDILIRIDISNMDITVQSKPITLLVRYVKLERGIQTKTPYCMACDGKGCEKCGEKGFLLNVVSVENVIRKEFSRSFEASNIKISWSGTEDTETRVLGNGRPIFVQVLDPKKRYIGFIGLGRQTGELIQFPFIEYLLTGPEHFEGLRKVILYRVFSDKPVQREKFEFLYSLQNIWIPSASKKKKKLIYCTNPIQVSENEFTLLCLMDNGVNPWKVLKGSTNESKFEGILDLLGVNPDARVLYDIVNFEVPQTLNFKTFITASLK